MKVFLGIVMGAVLTASVVLMRREIRTRTRCDGEAETEPRRREPSPLCGVVEETLRRQIGNDSLMAHAFEQALEEEHRLERQLAREAGLKI